MTEPADGELERKLAGCANDARTLAESYGPAEHYRQHRWLVRFAEAFDTAAAKITELERELHLRKSDAGREAVSFIEVSECHKELNRADVPSAKEIGKHRISARVRWLIEDRAAVRARLKEDEWQPIETAKVGIGSPEVIVRFVTRSGRVRFVSAENPTGKQWWAARFGAITPTHWCPTPKPPALHPKEERS